MNERIEEFYRQIGVDFKNFQRVTVTDDDMRKFAELIVRECIQVCQSRIGNRDYNTGRMHCMSDIREHFGVKE